MNNMVRRERTILGRTTRSDFMPRQEECKIYYSCSGSCRDVQREGRNLTERMFKMAWTGYFSILYNGSSSMKSAITVIRRWKCHAFQLRLPRPATLIISELDLELFRKFEEEPSCHGRGLKREVSYALEGNHRLTANKGHVASASRSMGSKG